MAGAGWPKSIDPTGIGKAIQRSPVVGDITGDGQPEIIAANVAPIPNEHTNEIFVWSANGTPLPGWPKVVDGFGVQPALEDMNGDGVNEIVYTDFMQRIQVIRADGTSLPGFPVLLPVTGGLSPPAIGDVNANGTKEIVVATSWDASQPLSLYVVSSVGGILPGWPRVVDSLGPPLSASLPLNYPVVGDLDGDGDLEIAIGGRASWTPSVPPCQPRSR